MKLPSPSVPKQGFCRILNSKCPYTNYSVPITTVTYTPFQNSFIYQCDVLREVCKIYPDGIYELSGVKIEVKEVISRLIETGTLAGSTLTMDKAFKNVLSLGYSAGDVFKMASTNPAKSINAYTKEKIGLIKPGYRADMVILDQNYEVIMTIVDGYVVYEKK